MKQEEISLLQAVDFFCGVGGMSLGLQAAGIRVLGGIDNDGDCSKTYEANIVGARFVRQDLTTLSAALLAEELNIRVDDPNLVFAGCSPCQYWSKIRTDKTKSAQTAFLLEKFQKFIHHFRPGFVVVENVPGIYTRKTQTILPEFLDFLSSMGYSWRDGIINANNYGVPQKRVRYLLVASRFSKNISLPTPTPDCALTVHAFIGSKNGFSRIDAGQCDPKDLLHSASALSLNNLRRIRQTPKSGGDRSSWKDTSLQIAAYQGKDEIFRDVYGRMYWDRPAPTITTRFNSFSNGRFGHPEEDRAISIREGATLQTFPRSFVFHSENRQKLTRQIGNAVPPELGRRIGLHLVSVASNG